MKTAVALALGVVVTCAGCTSSSRQKSAHPPMQLYSDHSTAQRLSQADLEIERRADGLERKGMSRDEARQYAEIEYLKSRAGSPLR